MSQANVERVRRAYEAISNRDERFRLSWEAVHGVMTALLHQDVEWHDQRELPGATKHHGIEGVMRHLAAARETLDYYAFDLQELLDADRGVVAVYRIHARGRFSGAPVERGAVYVYSFRGAKVERVEIFGTRT